MIHAPPSAGEPSSSRSARASVAVGTVMPSWSLRPRVRGNSSSRSARVARRSAIIRHLTRAPRTAMDCRRGSALQSAECASHVQSRSACSDAVVSGSSPSMQATGEPTSTPTPRAPPSPPMSSRSTPSIRSSARMRAGSTPASRATPWAASRRPAARRRRSTGSRTCSWRPRPRSIWRPLRACMTSTSTLAIRRARRSSNTSATTTPNGAIPRWATSRRQNPSGAGAPRSNPKDPLGAMLVRHRVTHRRPGSRFVASDRTGRPWITLIALRGVH